jgi:penicillin-binding protein 2
VFCPGFIKFGNKIYHCWNKNGHGTVNFYQALERSCNVFFYRMGMLLGIDKIFKYASQLGIGKKTGIEIRNEIAGMMPNSKWKEQTLGEPWQPGENLSNAIGQGFVLATPIQMVVAYSTIAMEGIGYKPHIVKKLSDQDDKLIEETKPSILYDLTKPLENGKPLVSKNTFKEVIKGLSLVTNGNFGTAKYYKLPGIEYAGKTGTAQNFGLSNETVYLKCENRPIRQRHHGWFIAFAPTEHPMIAVAILAEHACHGASGAPIVRDTMLAYFRKYHPDMLVNDNIQINVKAAPGPMNDE